MKIEIREKDKIVVFSVSGRLALGDNCFVFRDEFMKLLEARKRKVVVDLGGVPSIDSSGIAELARSFIESRRWGSRIKYTNLSWKSAKSLEIMGLASVLEIMETVDDAIRSFKEEKLVR